MTKKSELENKLETKTSLATKYRRKAERTKSVNTKAKWLRRSECYRRRAEVLKSQMAG